MKTISALMLVCSLSIGACKKKEQPVTHAPEVIEETPAPVEAAESIFAVGDDLNTDVPLNLRALERTDFTATPVGAQWSTFRGDAARSGLRDAPAITTPRILWRTQVGIGGYPNTIVEDAERLFVSTQGDEHDAADRLDGVVALNKSNGGIAWRYHTESDANGMTIADGVLYVVTDGGFLHAIDAGSGKTVWVRELGCESYTAPVVDGAYLLIERGGRVERFFRNNGAPEAAGGQCRHGERAAVSVDGDTVVSGALNGKLRYFVGGERKWTAAAPEGRETAPMGWVPSQLLSGVVVSQVNAWPFATGEVDRSQRPRYNSRAAIVVRWRNTGEVAWLFDINGVDEEANTRASRSYYTSLPLVVNDRMYVVSTLRPEITVLDVLSGRAVDRVALPDCRFRQFASLVGTPTHGYLARHDGVLYQFDYATSRVTWSLSLGKASLSGARTTHDGVSGTQCTASPVDGSSLFATPMIAADGTVYVHSGEGWVYAIGQAL